MLKHGLSRALSLPPHVAVSRAVRKIANEFRKLPLRRHDLSTTTFASVSIDGDLHTYFPAVPSGLLRVRARQVCALAIHTLAHRFDLLGSGWVKVRHGMQCRGLEGHWYVSGTVVEPDPQGDWLEDRISIANVDECRRVWKLIDQPYAPIDWQLDFKSGFRWSEQTWYGDIVHGQALGVDIKVPWELARMQHLPQLAWAFALAVDGKRSSHDEPEDSAQRYLREFCNQVLDFIATNPPRFGVNWACTMDVAIRVSNWLVAYDLFRAYGARFDGGFEAVFRRSVYEHGLHIVANLEWQPRLRANHYLANIVGLLFVAAYLLRTAELDAWLAFAVQELVAEVGHQFFPDGANFEASTSYHRLSGEMVSYATALVLGLSADKMAALQSYDSTLLAAGPGLRAAPVELFGIPGSTRRSPFPAWYFERLERMAEFTMHITKPSGDVPQIGDNDSGRFLKLDPACRVMSVAEAKRLWTNLADYSDLPPEAEYWAENQLDHSHLVAAIGGIIPRPDFDCPKRRHPLEQYVCGALCREPIQHRDALPPAAAEAVCIGSESDLLTAMQKLGAASATQKKSWSFLFPGTDLRTGLRRFAYPHFGLYIFRSERVYLAVRCGPIGTDGFGVHAHNDQLSVELNIDGEDRLTDPGTYLYTPLPACRDRYRSVTAHFAPCLGGAEPARFEHTFKLGDTARAECSYFGAEAFVGRHYGYGRQLYRLVQIESDGIRVEDWLESGVANWASPLPPKISPGYGVVLG